VSYSDHKVILRNYEGYITTYEEPQDYRPHDQASCQYCQHPRPEPGQEGITGLLDGKRMWIEPAGFGQVHERGSQEQHRLKDPAKWVPFGVGAIEGSAVGTELPVLEAGADYGPGEEPRPADGLPTASVNHELL
jgi:lysine 2,3-aminomutase